MAALTIERTGKHQGASIRDGKLDRVARDVVAWTPDMKFASTESLAFLLSYYGAVGVAPAMVLLRGSDNAEEQSLLDLRKQIEGSPGNFASRRFGVGVHRALGMWTALLLFQEMNVKLAPVPRALPSHGHALFAGRLGPGFHHPQVVFTPPKGAIGQLATTNAGSDFSAKLSCDQGDGAYQVEILADSVRGPTVLASFPVYCGVAPPARFVPTVSLAPATFDPAQAEAQLFELVNRDRKANGLPALVLDARLCASARGHSREMAEDGVVAHLSKRSGSMVDRAKAAGLSPPPTVLAENVGSAMSAQAVEQDLMASPGHRANVLSRDVTHVGIGVARGLKSDTSNVLYFTQVFAGWK